MPWSDSPPPRLSTELLYPPDLPEYGYERSAIIPFRHRRVRHCMQNPVRRESPCIETFPYLRRDIQVKTVACFCFLVFAADSLGRRRSLLWTSIAQSVSMFIVGIYIRVNPPVTGEPVWQGACGSHYPTVRCAKHVSCRSLRSDTSP